MATPEAARRPTELFRSHERTVAVRIDRLIVRLMLVQWVVGILATLAALPRTGSGTTSEAHAPVLAVFVLGGVITLCPSVIALRRPGTRLSRHTIAVGQSLASALFIHLSEGRIESHFHVFGSLALLALYRDWRVLVTASAVVVLDHVVGGVLAGAGWRWLEHAGWVGFAAAFLVISCLHGRSEMRAMAECQARLEVAHEDIEEEVLARASEFISAHERLRREMEERADAEKDRDRLSRELLQAQKLEAVGQLAAGIAHEINTPTQYIGDNTRFLQEAFEEITPLLGRAQALAQAVRNGQAASDICDELNETLEKADVEYLAKEIPLAIGQCLEGVRRVSKIVSAMKEFSHPGVEKMTGLDLNHAIESTITVARNEWKYVAEMETDFDPELPLVPCIPGEINQVVLNMLINAAHAIADVVGDGADGKGTITVSTRRDGDFAEVRIEDTGSGIPEAARARVFDPFFTTKEVGKGTGQGLSIAHKVIVQKHCGALEFETELGKGTTFLVRLPLKQAQSDLADAAA